MYWWTIIVRDLSVHKNSQIRYWNVLRATLRKLHMLSYYKRELMYQLQRLQQKDKIVEEYRQIMKLLLIKARIIEEPRIVMVRF